MIASHIDSARHRVLALSGLMLFGALATLYLASYLFLIKLNNVALPPQQATPFTVLSYWLQYGDDPYTRRWLMICLLVGAVPAIGVVATLMRPVRRALHGDARFATLSEVRRAGLLGDGGLILGRWGRRFIVLGKQLGTLCAASPRSGKGAGLVQPNALSFAGSWFVLDVRKECWRITAGWRSTFSETFLFDPLAEDGRTAQWNPMSYVRDAPALRINDLQKLANQLSPSPVVGDEFWPAACRDLFLGLGLYVLETPGLPRTLGEVMRQIMHGDTDTVGEHWREVIRRRDVSNIPLSLTCKGMLYDFINLAPPTQSSVRKTFTAKLQLWTNPMIDAATSGDSFDFRELRRRKISIYLGVNPGDIDRLSLLLSLFCTQLIDANMDKMPEEDATIKHELLGMFDEFAALGKMPIFASAISAMGGYGIRPFIIIQAMAQLRALYGADVAEVIATCCGGLVVFAPREQKYAEDISKMLGKMTVKARSRSRQVMSNSLGNINTSDVGRDLLNPTEVKHMGINNEIVFVEGVRPIMCRKIWYWKVRFFRRRANLPLPHIEPITITVPMQSVIPGHATMEPPAGARVVTPDKQIEPAANPSHPITPADVKRLPKLSLTDYAVDFSKVELPKGEPVTDDDLKKAFGSFLQTIEASKGC
jgi:type IV secretion system protein VirD4